MTGILLAELPLIVGLLVTGAMAGILAGLLGVGGGIIIVPVLFTVLSSLDVSADIRMHVAVGTSLATIIPTSLASLRAHQRKGAVDWPLFKSWLPGLVIGVGIGTWLATTQVSGASLAMIFAVVALCVATDLMLRDRSAVDNNEAPHNTQYKWFYRPRVTPIVSTIGALSAMMGIGGGTLSVPFLNGVGFPMHRAVATSAAFGFVIAVPAALGYVIGGWDKPEIPFGSVGYVNVIGVVFITTASTMTAPIGTRLAHQLKARTLRLLFAGFLIVTALRMLGTF